MLSPENAREGEGGAGGTVMMRPLRKTGEAFSLTVGAFLLTAKLLWLQSLKALIRRTFPL